MADRIRGGRGAQGLRGAVQGRRGGRDRYEPKPGGGDHLGAQGPARPRGHSRRAQGLRQQRRRLDGERDRHSERQGRRHHRRRREPSWPRHVERRAQAARLRVRHESRARGRHGHGEGGRRDRGAAGSQRRHLARREPRLCRLAEAGGGRPRHPRPKTMTRAGAVPLDKTPRAVDASPDGKRVYFTLAGVNAVQVLDTATNQIVAQIAVGVSPHQAPPTADGRWDLVVAQGPGELDIVDTSTNALAAAVPVGKTPHWVAIASDGRTAWVTNEGSNEVSVVDLGKRTVTATIAVGNAPRKIAVQPMGAPRSAAPAGAATAAASQTSAKSATLAGVVHHDHGTRDISGQRVVKMEADDYYFGPTFLRGKPGQRVRLRVENESGTLHTITIADQQIDRDILPKKSIEVDVTAPPSGAVTFTCKFHGPLGITGQLATADPKTGSAH